MTLQTFGRIVWPTTLAGGGNQSILMSAVNATFDSSSDRIAWVGRAEVTDSLTAVRIRTANVVTGSTLEMRVETVSNGRPTGTLFGTNTNVTVAVADTDDNTWITFTLTAAASLTKGQEFAVVLVNSSGTPNMQLGLYPAGLSAGSARGQYPLCLQDTGGGTWAGIDGLQWILQFSSAGVIFTPGMNPVSGAGTITSFNSSSSPDERALRFQLPAAVRAFGVRALLLNIAAGADFTFSLWSASGTTDAAALAQASIDGDFALSTTQDGHVDLIFPTPVELAANTTYYAGVRADTANNIGLGELSNSSVTNAMRAFPGVNAQTYLSTRAWSGGTAGPWSDTTTTLPLIYLLIDQIHDGAGGGLAALPLGGYVR